MSKKQISDPKKTVSPFLSFEKEILDDLVIKQVKIKMLWLIKDVESLLKYYFSLFVNYERNLIDTHLKFL